MTFTVKLCDHITGNKSPHVKTRLDLLSREEIDFTESL